MLEKVKMSLRITTDAFDEELQNLIMAAMLDIGITDVSPSSLESPDALISLAVITYCKMHFGAPEEYDRLEKSYWEQKAQLLMSSSYTNYEG